MVSGSRPAWIASGACAYHSYCEPQYCAVMMIAISLRRLSSEVLKRTYSPTFCRRSASSGLRSQALNGPLILPRGPDMIASATVRWAGVILSSGISAKRSPFSASAEPARSRETADIRSMVFMGLLPFSPGLNAGPGMTLAGPIRQTSGHFRQVSYLARLALRFDVFYELTKLEQIRRHRARPGAASIRRIPGRPQPPCGLPDREPERRAGRGLARLS